MADVHTKEQRSYNMSRIKGKDAKPEVLNIEVLFLKIGLVSFWLKNRKIFIAPIS